MNDMTHLLPVDQRRTENLEDEIKKERKKRKLIMWLKFVVPNSIFSKHGVVVFF